MQRPTIAIPPTIPSDQLYTSDYTRIQKVTKTLMSEKIVIPYEGGENVMEPNRLTGLKTPVDDDDAANYAYAFNVAGSGYPGLPVQSVQYKVNAGTFGGSSDLMFNPITNVLTSKIMKVGDIEMEGQTISGLDLPINPQDVANKQYIESRIQINQFVNSTDSGILYTAAQVSNALVVRELSSDTDVIDQLPSAASIISHTGGTVDATFTFSIKNNSPPTNFNSVIRIIAEPIDDGGSLGEGMTMMKNTTQNIYPGYQMTAMIRVTSPTTVEFVVLNNMRSLINENFNYRYNKSLANINVVQCKDFYSEYVPYDTDTDFPIVEQTQITSGVYAYVLPLSMVFNRYIYLAANTVDGTGVGSNRISITNLLSGMDYHALRGTSMMFSVINPSTSSFPAVFSTSLSNWNENITLDNTVNTYSIPAGKLGQFIIVWSTPDNVNTVPNGILQLVGIMDSSYYPI